MSVHSQDALIALARAMSAQGNVSSGDINTLLSPELGYLTDTFYGQDGQGEEDDELLWMDYAPNFRRAMDLPDDNIRKQIAAEIYRGSAPWDVKRQIEEYTAGQAQSNPGLINEDGETEDLQSFANTVFSEYNNYQVAKTKADRTSAGKDPFAAGGIPPQDMDFSLEQLAPDVYQQLYGSAQKVGQDSKTFSQRGTNRSSALKFLQQQKIVDKNRVSKNSEEYRSGLDYSKPEGYRAAFNRNMSNTPMGRGETGFTGLVPLYKYLEQIPASAFALKDSIMQPTIGYATEEADYISRNTVGKGLKLPKGTTGKDVLGIFLHGNKYKKSAPTDDGSFDRAENARFGRTAQSVVDRSENVASDISDNDKKAKWIRDYSQALEMIMQSKARSVGYTPYQEAMVKRANFMRAGGQ